MKSKTEKNKEFNERLKHLHTIDDKNTLYIYTDGSRTLDDSNNCISVSGSFIIVHNKTIKAGYRFKTRNKDIIPMWNVGSEVLAAYLGLRYALSKFPNFKNYVIVHDYEGISLWGTGVWKIKPKTAEIVKLFRNFNLEIEKSNKTISYIRVASHTIIKNYATLFNNIVDSLAEENKNSQDITILPKSLNDLVMLTDEQLYDLQANVQV